MTENIFLSIIIPCYNVAQYIPATLNSLSALQDAEDCEFIFINDGSTDETPALLSNFAKLEKRAVYISQTNQGVSAARNAAIHIARGQYILCLDGDDTLTPNAVSIIRQNIRNHDALLSPVFIVHHNNSTLQKLSIPQGEYTITQLFQASYMFPTAPMLVYKASIIKSNTLCFNSKIKCGEVYDFTISFFKYAHTIHVIDTAFYNYIMREISATHAPNYQSDATVLHLLDHLAHNQSEWTKSTAFLTTIFRMICSFTYNKYLRLNLTDKDTLDTLTLVMNSTAFQDLLHHLSQCNRLTLRDKLMIKYLSAIPTKNGYLFLTRLYHIAHQLTNIFQQVISSH